MSHDGNGGGAAAPSSGASSASETPSQSSTPAAAVSPSTEQGATPTATDAREQFIPRQRFDEVNTERNTLKQWREQYAWAEKVPQAELERAIAFANRINPNNEDAVEALGEMLAEFQSHPVHGPKLKSWAARELSRRGGGQQQQGPDLSNLIIDLGNGQTLPLNALGQQVLAQVQQALAPDLKTIAQLRQQQEQAALAQQVETFATTTSADIKSWPGMDSDENQQLFVAELQKIPIKSDDPREVELAAERAYRKAVLPRIAATAQAKQLDSLQRKAAANSSINPSNAAPAAAADIRSFNDPRLKW